MLGLPTQPTSPFLSLNMPVVVRLLAPADSHGALSFLGATSLPEGGGK